MATRKLTLKQVAFINWYVNPNGGTLYNATRSAEKAGYKGNAVTLSTMGSENLRKPAIKREIWSRIAELMPAVDLTLEKVLGDLEFHRIMSLQKGDMGSANKALELQGKYLKMFADRVEHVHSVEDATEEDLVSLLTDLIGKIDGFDVARLTALLGGGESPGGSGVHSEGAPTTH